MEFPLPDLFQLALGLFPELGERHGGDATFYNFPHGLDENSKFPKCEKKCLAQSESNGLSISSLTREVKRFHSEVYLSTVQNFKDKGFDVSG